MSRYYCYDEDEHRRDARRDFDCGRKDYDYYDEHASDACKRAYTEEYEHAERDDRERREYLEAERQHEEHEAQRRHEFIERQQQEEEEFYYRMEEDSRQEQQQEPPSDFNP